jgi:hypothetical protein
VKISKTYRPELLVSKGKEAHPLLTDPYLDVKNERLVATNGHGLVSLPVSVDKDESSRYLACSLLKAARALGEDDEPAEIKNEKVVKYGVLWPTAQERTFPDVKKLWPTFGRGSEGTVTFALNPGLLHAIANAMGVDAVCLTVELAATEENPSPIVVQPVFKKALEVGLLMPMRADGAGVPILAPDQVCRTCGRLLAAGASCPKCTTEDGAPAGSVAEAVGRVRSALAELQEKHPGAKVSVHFAPGVKTDPPPLPWKQVEDDLLVALVAGGKYGISRLADGGHTAAWQPEKGRGKILAIAKPLDDCRDACWKHHLERIADEKLPPEMKKAELKGDAVAHKKGRRRA